MRYLPTIDVWDSGIYSALKTGQLKLQSGQYIKCGNGIKSRFISINNGVINAVHGGSNIEVNKKFIQRIEIKKSVGVKLWNILK